ncbi:MAG: hypothetical protein KJ623_04205, partial [Nanoarchaeota archaeon]|nr:hypothetical protein [Nanoarchaeota archaeon]
HLTNNYEEFFMEVFYNGKFYRRIELSKIEFKKMFDAMDWTIRNERNKNGRVKIRNNQPN